MASGVATAYLQLRLPAVLLSSLYGSHHRWGGGVQAQEDTVVLSPPPPQWTQHRMAMAMGIVVTICCATSPSSDSSSAAATCCHPTRGAADLNGESSSLFGQLDVAEQVRWPWVDFIPPPPPLRRMPAVREGGDCASRARGMRGKPAGCRVVDKTGPARAGGVPRPARVLRLVAGQRARNAKKPAGCHVVDKTGPARAGGIPRPPGPSTPAHGGTIAARPRV